MNENPVEVMVIAASGITDNEPSLFESEQAAILVVDAALNADPEFSTLFSEAQLVRVDSNRGLANNRQGRIYLRYRHAKGVTEYWGHIGKMLKIDHGKRIMAGTG